MTAVKIALASSDRERMALLASGLWTAAEAEIHQVQSSVEVLELLTAKQVELLIVDEDLRDMRGLELVRIVATRHPFVNCMLVSTLPADVFHEKTEGLGVLMQLESPPKLETARKIIDHLSAISASQFVS